MQISFATKRLCSTKNTNVTNTMTTDMRRITTVWQYLEHFAKCTVTQLADDLPQLVRVGVAFDVLIMPNLLLTVTTSGENIPQLVQYRHDVRGRSTAAYNTAMLNCRWHHKTVDDSFPAQHSNNTAKHSCTFSLSSLFFSRLPSTSGS